jgi:hypothetical protein
MSSLHHRCNPPPPPSKQQGDTTFQRETFARALASHEALVLVQARLKTAIIASILPADLSIALPSAQNILLSVIRSHHHKSDTLQLLFIMIFFIFSLNCYNKIIASLELGDKEPMTTLASLENKPKNKRNQNQNPCITPNNMALSLWHA